jgi:aspartyl-tRNA(Asn)/glutamyl-tRNA(Gln) amidotransferase subunit A
MASFDDNVFFSGAAEINARLRNREFSAMDLTRAFCDRLERFGPRFNALALLLREDALRLAQDVDRDLKRGRTRGPLQGVPYAVKDLLSVAGRPTTWGAKPFAGQVFDSDATPVRKLAKAGAILIAKLSMVELAGGGGYRYAAASLFGPGRNPWDPERWSGGSSSGSGSAVAAGLVPYALGSETSGSIVTPAAFCGVTGLRPTYGLVSRAGSMALSWTMDKIGVLARTVDDCGHVLQTIAGGDAEDPGSARKSFHYAPQFARSLKDLRAGFAPGDFDDAADSAMRPALKEGLEVFRSLGVQIREVELPDLPYGAVTSTIISAEGSTVFADLIESGKVDELADRRQIAGLRAGLEISAREYLQAMRVRRLVQQAFSNIFKDFDLLISPARFNLASRVTDPLDRPAPAPKTTQARGLRALIPAGNLAGIPALVLPCGFADGLPVAISVVGRAFSENTLLKAGLEFQKATDWHRRRPKLS